MKINNLELIDFQKVDVLLEGFNKTTGFVTAILDVEGNVLSKSGWRQICTHFHRINPDTSANCTISDTELANKLDGEHKYHFYKCLNGLVDVAVPIVIKGEHVANLFTGQFFFEAPDLDFFAAQADKYGFNKQEYMDSLKLVPVISFEEVKTALDFLLNMTQLISEITFQKKEQALLNERISTATKASQVGIWDWDVLANQLNWDDQMYVLYGIRKEDFSGAYEAWVNGLHPEDREASKNETELALEGIKDFDTEFRVVWPDGSIHTIKGKGEVFRDEKGNPIRMMGINLDITEQKKAEEIIRRKNEEFRKLSSNVPGLIYQFTRRPDGSYFVPVASEGIRNIFGCTPEDVLDNFDAIGRVLYHEDVERVIKEIENSAVHLTYFTCEFRVHIPGRDVQWIYSQSTPERLADGSVTWYGFNADITEMKKAEEKVKKLNETLELRVSERTLQLESANKELEAFSYSVSHDLRAPLRHINGYVDLLNNRFKNQLPEKARYYLDTVADASKQMGSLIDDLLQFSRTGRQELKKVKLNMNEIINEVITASKQDIRGRHINWSIPILPEVFGDFSLIKLVWVNLIDNAIKYTRLVDSAEITIECRKEKDHFVFSIQDNGVGFDMKYAQKLFGVFQRMHAQTEFEGTGIGLANVQRIIHKHHGKVWAEAEPDKGAAFYFTLPC